MAKTYDDREREWFKSRMEECLEKAKRPPFHAENFSGLRQATIETQRRMGITRSKGEGFCRPDYKKRD